MHLVRTQILCAAFSALTLAPAFGQEAGSPSTMQDSGEYSEAEIREFLYSTDGTYGWQPVKGTIMYDFFKDGRLAVQGPDGEATMWEGKWKLKGDQLTLSYADNSGKTKTWTVTVSIDGDDLLLDDKRYKRYSP